MANRTEQTLRDIYGAIRCGEMFESPPIEAEFETAYQHRLAEAGYNHSVAIGREVYTTNVDAVAIGYGAQAASADPSYPGAHVGQSGPRMDNFDYPGRGRPMSTEELQGYANHTHAPERELTIPGSMIVHRDLANALIALRTMGEHLSQMTDEQLNALLRRELP